MVIQRHVLFSFSTKNAEAAGGSAPIDYSGPTFVSPFSNKDDDDDDSSY